MLVSRGPVWQHRESASDGFTKRYGCKMLVWFEQADTMEAAILREKQIKAGSRAKKLALIAAHPALEFCGWWNNWDPESPLTADSSEIFRPIALVRRK